MCRKTMILTQAQAFHNAAMQAPYMSSKYIMYRRAQKRLMASLTPTGQIKTIIDTVATTRNVTLYKGSN